MKAENEIDMIELFSGIGGFSKGFEDGGFKIKNHYFSEIDKHAIANYKYNFPNAKYIGSVTDISGRDFTGIDIITFGSPCQDFSLAGKREGMDGKRSVLILEAIRLVTELRPPVFIWENVKGAFSSNSGADFWAILQAFANIGGYRLEWQLLNTKWFLPQNRERIYLVGHLAGSERSFGNVFPISEDKGLHSETGSNTEKANSTASALMAGHHKSQTGNFLLCDSGKSRTLEKRNILPPLRANTGAGHGNYVVGTWRTMNDGKGFRQMTDNISPTIQARAREDGSGQPIIRNETSIRRLTEIECERLQGFPDDWTKYGIYEKQIWTNKKENTFKIVQDIQEIPKTQRYKMLGNAVTVRVVEEIAKRLLLPIS